MRNDVHVMPRAGEWVVEVEGEVFFSTHRTQEEAIDRARALALANDSELVVYFDRDEFGTEPPPPIAS